MNHLIQIEHVSAILYLAMSNYMNQLNLRGVRTWFRLQHLIIVRKEQQIYE
ncbi:ferritin-like domain-containing protein [Ectobacillus funiculus]|uniref:ferritin-like domain-containing protein n=1 Tax=Ectobacillus funiculus TaxID=137993 RepID=UPI0024827B27|nr:ferritin-like domain-containing protein [Ectobacillus funiculus]